MKKFYNLGARFYDTVKPVLKATCIKKLPVLRSHYFGFVKGKEVYDMILTKSQDTLTHLHQVDSSTTTFGLVYFQ